MQARLRVCASCEWIFKTTGACPRCQFASYSAHYVYGNKAYRFAKTQQPYIDRKLATVALQLDKEVAAYMTAE